MKFDKHLTNYVDMDDGSKCIVLYSAKTDSFYILGKRKRKLHGDECNFTKWHESHVTKVTTIHEHRESHPKISIFINGKYQHSTKWSKTVRDAIAKAKVMFPAKAHQITGRVSKW